MKIRPQPALRLSTGPKNRKRWRLRAHNEISKNETPISHHYGFPCEEESTENEDVVIDSGSILLKIPKSSDPNPKIVPSFEMPHCIGKNRELDPNESFDTQETVASSDFEDDFSNISSIDEDEGDSSSQESSSSCHSKRSIRFADEVGLPIQNICHYECDRREREHSELLVLCLLPEQKKFEFLHVGYHQYGEDNGTTVQTLLNALPGMCTDHVFSLSKFDAIYRANKVDKAFVKLCATDEEGASDSDSASSVEDSSLTLAECAFKENELLVASVRGSSERAVLEGIGSLLSNQKIVKTLKRARRSRRSLQFVSGETKKERRSRQRKRRSSKKKKQDTVKETMITEEDIKALDSCIEYLDEYCHDYDPLREETEFCRQLLVAIVTVCSGTAVFSAMGIK
eukprot:CAMPEP_0172396456 /NCGR_PEP_ID=MMETSP1061-20121228/25118_1 /TAXON_ID=37318 /ORGANISM="Pseudo-nitzschia pungens, Strain cf. pungens" /LENGTH=398 /DNA_ID=CAMNT_0013128293 /DNA_START=93 /DNA_END=1289 /DNA_ORIENTATION=-